MYTHLLFFAYWIINSLVLFTASVIIPGNEVTLGSWRFSGIESAIYAGFWLTFLIWVWWDFAIARRLNSTKKFVAVSYFLFVNVFCIFALSRFPALTGLTLKSFWLAVILGVVTTTLQRLAWRRMVKKGSVFGWI